ncbi:DNA damage-repair/toleration protein DRT100-like protein, partial [Tanacetum coccineum]
MSTYLWWNTIVFTLAVSVLTLTANVSACPPSDLAALLAFKAALREPYLGIFNSWTGTDCCNKWYGITCDPSTKRVADIALRGESEDPLFQKAKRTG